jgi:preprotein translocase subunit SecD
MYFVEERTIGPSLGKENIEAGLKAAVYGFLLVVVFMVVNYRLVGVFGLHGTAGQPSAPAGAAGRHRYNADHAGYCRHRVDHGYRRRRQRADHERIREELRKGLPVQQAMNSGYARAWATIFDSHVTTLIVGLVLFGFGAGSVKGFAITLSLGIITSLYTAVVFSRVQMNWMYGNKPVKSLSIQPLWART